MRVFTILTVVPGSSPRFPKVVNITQAPQEGPGLGNEVGKSSDAETRVCSLCPGQSRSLALRPAPASAGRRRASGGVVGRGPPPAASLPPSTELRLLLCSCLLPTKYFEKQYLLPFFKPEKKAEKYRTWFKILQYLRPGGKIF